MLAELIQNSAAVVTAVATVVLVYATLVLARETKVLSRSTSQAHVTVSLEPNQWSVRHFDIVIENSGNAPAYEIEVSFDPPLPESASYRKDRDIPYSSISLLRPGKAMESSLCAYGDIEGKTFRVTVSWTHRPETEQRETLTYKLAMADFDGVSYLGARSPVTQIAEQVKNLREDWQSVARGRRRIQTDTHTEEDRREEAAQREANINRMRERKERLSGKAPGQDMTEGESKADD